MKLAFFDIETYEELFCFCAITYDSETHNEVGRVLVKSDEHGNIYQADVDKIDECFSSATYIISFNGSRFDLPVLAKVRSDAKRLGVTNSQYIYHDAMQLISYDEHRNIMNRNKCYVRTWSDHHFDLFVNCLGSKSLKQWEMYCNLPIKELPYNPSEKLTNDMKQEIIDYCFHDVWATSQVYWRFGSGEQKYNYHTLPARKAILDKEWPQELQFKFDRTAQAISGAIIYNSFDPITPITTNPLALFNINEFDVPQEVKDIITTLATTPVYTEKERKELTNKCVYKGVQLGKGGCHYIKKGQHKDLYCFDVASQYPRTIDHWKLLKTEDARKKWKEMMLTRMEIKAKKGTPDYKPDLDLGYKVIVLNSLSGGFRIRSGNSVEYDIAAGEAMCYISQLVILELALACPNWEDVVEINTDSVFVVGEENAKVMRTKCEQMLKKYDMLFEEDFIECAYFRDVNNYGVYDHDGKLLDGRGIDYKDAFVKNHEVAVVKELFNNLVKPKLELDWSKYDWKDFIYKYHKGAASKYAAFNGEPFTHKNYYFLWTTRDVPEAGHVQFSNDLIDRRNGSIKTRYGVYAFNIEELEQYKDFIDYKQYQRDLDELFYLWGRTDLIETMLGDTKTRKASGIKTPKSLSDVMKLVYPWTEEIK